MPFHPASSRPLRWGTEEGLAKLLDDATRSIESEPRPALQYYRSFDHAVEVFGRYFGPTIRASEAANAEGQQRLREDLGAVFARYSRGATDGSAVVENTYLLTVAIKDVGAR